MAPMISALISAVGAIIFLSSSSTSFTALPKLTRHNVCHHTTAPESFTSLPLASADEENSNPTKKETFKSSNPLELAAWYGVEAFGKVFRQEKNNNVDANSGSVDLTNSPLSLKETLARIQLDNDRYYFLSGEVDRLIYDEDCVFSDPFVSFNGRDRFIDNLSNLGSFITNYDAKMISYNVEDDGKVINTKIMVKLELNLPWKPVLAWPWGVKYEVDPTTYLIRTHEESWDIAPWEGVKQIFRKPTVKISR